MPFVWLEVLDKMKMELTFGIYYNNVPVVQPLIHSTAAILLGNICSLIDLLAEFI